MRDTSQHQKILAVAWCCLSVVLVASLFLFLDAKDRAIAWRTLSLGGLVSLVAIPLAVTLAWTANGRGLTAAMTRGFLIVGVLTPVFAHVTAWDAAFGKLGWLTHSFGQVLTPIVARWPAAIWIQAMILTPQIAIVFLIAIRSGSRQWEDALRLETSRFGAAIRIGVWRFLPVVTAAVLWVMISCAREIGVTDIYQIGTLAEQVYLGYSLGQLNAIGAAWTPQQIFDAQHLGTAITMLLVGWLAGSGIWLFFSSVQRQQQTDLSQSHRPAQVQRNHQNWIGKRIVSILMLLLVVVVPVANLIGRVGFSVVRVDGEPVATWQLSAAVDALMNIVTNFQAEFCWSLLIASVAATLISMVALPAVWFCRRSNLGLFFMAVLFGGLAACPGPSIGLTIGKLFSLLPIRFVEYLYDRTIAAPVIANTVFCFPLALLLFFFLTHQVSQDQLAHAEVDGISPWRQFVSFGIVANWRTNLGCWFLVVAIGFGELSATQMVLPPGMDTVARRALGMLHAGVNESAAALTLVTLGAVLVFALLVKVSLSRRLKQTI